MNERSWSREALAVFAGELLGVCKESNIDLPPEVLAQIEYAKMARDVEWLFVNDEGQPGHGADVILKDNRYMHAVITADSNPFLTESMKTYCYGLLLLSKNITGYRQDAHLSTHEVALFEETDRTLFHLLIKRGLRGEADQRKGNPRKEQESTTKQTYVYLFRSSDGLYKIGYSTNLRSRLSSIRCASPYNVEMVCSIPSGKAMKLESELHSKFETKRVRREWFALDDKDVDYIVDIARSREE